MNKLREVYYNMRANEVEAKTDNDEFHSTKSTSIKIKLNDGYNFDF